MFSCVKRVPIEYDQLQLNDKLLMQKRIETMAARRTRPLGMAPADDFPRTISGDEVLFPCENENIIATDEETKGADPVVFAEDGGDIEIVGNCPPPLLDDDNFTDASDNIISEEEDNVDVPPMVNPNPPPKPVAKPPSPKPVTVQKPSTNNGSQTTTPLVATAHEPEVTNKTVDDGVTNEETPPELNDDVMERQTLLRQLDLLRMKFKTAVIQNGIEFEIRWMRFNSALCHPPRHRVSTYTNRQDDCRTQFDAIEARTQCARFVPCWVSTRNNPSVAMYKLGLAAFLVMTEFILARYTQLDMSRFLSWHTSNLASYEEILAEMSDYTTPFSTSPPYIQLMILILFNTAIFIGSALVQKALSVDILPIVICIVGHPGRPPDFFSYFLSFGMVKSEIRSNHWM